MLYETIDNDLKDAMKARDEIKVSTLRFLKSALKNKLIDKRLEKLTDEDVVEVIQKQAKQRQESIAEFKKANRTDLFEKESKELAILEHYLPKQLSDQELEAVVRSAITEAQVKTKSDIGKLMKVLMPAVRGKADGRRVNELVTKLLV